MKNPLTEYAKLWGKVHIWATKKRHSIREWFNIFIIGSSCFLDVFSILTLTIITVVIFASNIKMGFKIPIIVFLIHAIIILGSMTQDRVKELEKMLRR